jgi:hypothetical protein
MFRCDSCSASFTKRYALFRHRQSHGHLQKESDYAGESQDSILLNLDGFRNDIGSLLFSDNDNSQSQIADEHGVHDNHYLQREDFSDPSALSEQNESLQSEQNEEEFQQSAFPEFQDPPFVQTNEWFPFDNKTDFLLSALLTHPDRPSKRFFQYLWEILGCIGFHLPSLEKLQNIISKLPGKLDLQKGRTPSGALFSFISPSALVSQLFATKFIREQMLLYPESSETCDCIALAGKISNDFKLQTPMINLHGQRIFQNDIVELNRNGNRYHFLVRAFSLRQNVFHLRGFVVDLFEETVDSRELLEVSTADFDIELLQNRPRIRSVISGPDEQQLDLADLQKQHHLKEKSCAQNLDIFAVHFTLFSDDTSANKSKKWNKVDVVYLRLCSNICKFLEKC